MGGNRRQRRISSAPAAKCKFGAGDSSPDEFCGAAAPARSTGDELADPNTR
jgi:hypothetical protein